MIARWLYRHRHREAVQALIIADVRRRAKAAWEQVWSKIGNL